MIEDVGEMIGFQLTVKDPQGNREKQDPQDGSDVARYPFFNGFSPLRINSFLILCKALEDVWMNHITWFFRSSINGYD